MRIIVAAIGSGAVLCVVGMILAYQFTRPVKAVYHLDHLKINQPISVSFSYPVQDHLNYNLSPGLKGSWHRSHNLFGTTKITFQPEEPLVPGSSYDLQLGHVVPLLGSAPSITEETIPVQVERPAEITSTSPAASAQNVPVDTDFSLKLASANNGLRQLRLKSDAALASDQPTSSDDLTFTWKFKQRLDQGKLYHLSVLDDKAHDPTKPILDTTFTTVPEPHISSATSTDHLYPGDLLTIQFDQDMRQSADIFSFDFKGEGRWKDARSYEFKPEGLVAGHSYSYKVIKGARSVEGGVIEADHSFNISPPGSVYVVGSSPRGSNVGVSSALSFAFDQPVDHNSAQAHFSLSPATGGSFSWSGNTMTYHPSGLGYQTTYTAALSPGVKSVYGLDSTRSFSNSFATTYQIIKLGVPYFHQAYSLSCEASSLRMALAYRGVSTSDYDIIMHLNYNPVPRDTGSNSWSNPYQMFVGDVNGKEGSTGWGVYGPPIASAAQAYGRGAHYVSSISVNQIADAIHNNNPVVLWGFSGSAVKPDSWNTSSGAVFAPSNEHARTVYGVAGSASNPLGFYLHDPIYGDIYWTASQLQWNMTFGGYQPGQGVIVF